MSMTPENDTVSWRDMTDQLTDKQITELEGYERQPPALVDLSRVGGYRRQTTEELRDSLLCKARTHAEDNLSDAMSAHVPPPAGVVSLWDHWHNDGEGELRYFDGTSRRVERDRGEDVEVRICGTQYLDGHADRDEIRVYNVHGDDILTLAQARQLGRALLDACDEAEQMNNCDPIAVDS